MSDTDTAATDATVEAKDATTEAGKPELTPEQIAARKLNRAIGRALARVDGAPAEMKARWTEGRAKYVGEGKKLAKALAKEGVTLTLEEKAEASGEAVEA